MNYEINNFTYFSKSVMVFEDGGKLYKPPKFVNRARKRYRFDHDRKILQKSCKDCGQFIDAQVFEDGEFRDIHDEDIIHYMSQNSGYAVRCKKCEYDHEMNKEMLVVNDLEEGFSSSDNEIDIKVLIELSPSNQQFLNLVANVKGI